MKRELTCIICPRGCALTVEIEGERINVTGNACKRGEKYGIEECTSPTRTVTSTVRISNRPETMVSVKTADPIPKDKIFELMTLIREKEIAAPVEIGDIICDNVYGTRIIATKSVE